MAWFGTPFTSTSGGTVFGGHFRKELSNLLQSLRGVLCFIASLIFLLIALLAGLFGFGIIAGTSYLIAKVLFIVFLIFFVVSLIA